MYIADSHKIFQTLSGQGWRVLVDWGRADGDEPGFPRVTEEPVIAWVTTKITHRSKDSKQEYEDVIIAPLVRFPDGQSLSLLDWSRYKWAYLAPGEDIEIGARLLAGGHLAGMSLDARRSS